MKNLLVLAVLILTGCFSKEDSGSSTGPGTKSGTISFQIAIAQVGPFRQLAKTVELKISASDMVTLTKTLTIGDSSISGIIEGIPAGSNRTFELKVYDSLGVLQYQGSSIANISAGATLTLSITVVRVVGAANINGTIIESPTVGWTLSDGFESTTLSPNWTPKTTSLGGLTTTQVKSGSKAFQMSNDYRYTFPKSLSNGQISWWFYDQGGTYFFILTDTSKADLTVDNLHMTTVVPAGLSANKYSFYYKVGGYQQITRTAGWHQMMVTVTNGQISWSVDGVVGRAISQTLPVLGFQVSGVIMDDFYVVSNTD